MSAIMTQPRYRLLIDDYRWSFTLLAEHGGVWHPALYFTDIHTLADFARAVGENLHDTADMARVLASGIKAYQELAVPRGVVWDYVKNMEVIDKIGQTK